MTETVTNADFLNSLTGAVAIVPIVIAIVQVFKMTGKIPNQYAPLLSIVIGVGVAFLLKHGVSSLTNVILEGVLYGLSASGLYSGITTTMSATNNNNNTGTTQSVQATQIPNGTTTGQNTTKTESTTTTQTNTKETP